jgi:hypothetical protein
VRRALVAGFFDFVEEAVRKEFGDAMDRGDVVVVGLGRVDPRRGMNLELFKRALGQVLDGECSDLLIVLGRSTSWIEDSVVAVLAERECESRTKLEVRDDLRDAAPIVSRLAAFGLSPQPAEEDTALLMKGLEGERLFCVRSASQPSFERTLVRFGFTFDPTQFVEEIVPASKNSNLVQSLGGKAEQFDWLLYAWSGLRTLPSEVKRKFRRGALEADSPAKVAAMLSRAVLKRSGGRSPG